MESFTEETLDATQRAAATVRLREIEREMDCAFAAFASTSVPGFQPWRVYIPVINSFRNIG
jgi:hypothetical protein